MDLDIELVVPFFLLHFQVRRDVDLVYGGGSIGLIIGLIARTVLDSGRVVVECTTLPLHYSAECSALLIMYKFSSASCRVLCSARLTHAPTVSSFDLLAG